MINWEEIRKEWETSKITLKALADKHGVKLGTLKSRKSRECWTRSNEKKKDAIKSEKVATLNPKDATRRGAPKGNQNAKGNPGGSPPLGNKNAVTTGEYETIMWDYLDDDEKELFGVIETDPLYQIDITIRELSIRQRRMMKRIKRIEEGLTEKERRVLQELKAIKDVHQVHDDRTGETRHLPVKQEKLVTTEVEETEFRKIDDILSIEEALTRITNQLVKAIKQKHDIEKSYGQHPFELELMQQQVEKGNIELGFMRGDTEGDAHEQADNYEAALNAQVVDVFADEVEDDEET